MARKGIIFSTVPGSLWQELDSYDAQYFIPKEKHYFYVMSVINESLKLTILSVLRRQPIQRAAIFGSFARGEEQAHSDIDLLIEYSTPHSLFDILRLENELQDATSRKIDLVEYSAIKPGIKEKILSQAISIL